MKLGVALTLCMVAGAARADAPVVIRLATAAPDGTSWAREFKAFSRNVEQHTSGAVQVKWYFGGIAGDELQVADRLARGQVDGTASGGGFCQTVSPTMRVTRAQGLFRSHEEASYLLGRMRKSIEGEFRQHQLAYLGGPVIGGEYVFSKAPIRTVEEMQKAKLWRWDVDVVSIELSRLAGLDTRGVALAELGPAFDSGKVDAYAAIPATIVAFQVTSRVHYMIPDQPHGFLAGCLLVHQRVWDRLTPEQRDIVSGDAVQAITRVDHVTRLMDEQLLGGLFQKQGIEAVKASDELRTALDAKFKAAREKKFTGAEAEILKRFEALLAEHRKK
jgi:TRAP-type C4-dicarboxylate transport system substrate-binding protein